MDVIVKFSDLAQIRACHPGASIVFASGTFDLTHAGHALFLEDCKKNGEILVVGVGCDAVIGKYKGFGRPIVSEAARLKIIACMKPVDYCFLDEPSADGNFLSFLQYVFKELRPETYVINSDAVNIPYREEVVRKYGVRMVVLSRECPPEFDAISTSCLIEKIKKSPNE